MNLVPLIARLVVARLGWLFAPGDERDAEILALRHQIFLLARLNSRRAQALDDGAGGASRLV